MERVKIQYSIELEEIPTEVSKLFSRAANKTRTLADFEMCSLASLESGDEVSLKALRQIEDIRNKLTSIDYALSDAKSIIEGYINFKLQEEEHPADEPSGPRLEYGPESAPLPDGNSFLDHYANITDQMQQFKASSAESDS